MMRNSRTKNSFLTMAMSCIRQGLTLLLTFISRTVFIHILGAEYLGLNGLFSNILSLLALSELGINVAISFYLYKPLAEQDMERVKSLMGFYKICYRVVGLAIICVGSFLVPALPFLVNFDQSVPANLYLVYFLYLLNTAASYLFFAYKQALVTANQEQYKIEKVNISFTFINCIADIIVLIFLRNYIAYLVVKFLMVLFKNIIIAIKIDKEYPFIKEKNVMPLDKTEIMNFFKDIGDIALFRIGSTLFNATDNIIISMMLGTVVVGYYSNYYMIISQVTMVIGLLIRSFTAGIGNVVAKEHKDKQYNIFKQLDFVVYFIATVCTSCLFQLLNSFVNIWVGGVDERYILSQAVVLFLCLSFYFDSTTQIMNAFREASGNFKTGRALQLIGGIANIFLSVVLGKYYGLSGIFAATIVSKGLIAITPFIMGISENVFHKGHFTLLIRYYKNMLVMVGVLVVTWVIGSFFHMKGIVCFVIECCIASVIPALILMVVFWKKPEMQALKLRVKKIADKVGVK